MLPNPLAVEIVEGMWISGVEENPLNGHLSPHLHGNHREFHNAAREIVACQWETSFLLPRDCIELEKTCNIHHSTSAQ